MRLLTMPTEGSSKIGNAGERGGVSSVPCKRALTSYKYYQHVEALA